MHAASVNPEPGSNSRNICIPSDRRRSAKIYSELDCSFFTFFRVVFSFRIARCSFALACFILHLLLFNFQRPFRCRFRDSLIIITQLRELVNTFLKFFQCFLHLFCRVAVFSTASLFYHAPLFLSSAFGTFSGFLKKMACL